MEIGDVLYVTKRRDWRHWLEANYDKQQEIWLLSYKKSTGRPNLPYNDAVEEALCFGWIDSIRKTLDGLSYAQRFSPRLAGSKISQTNQERLASLLEQDRVIPSVRANLTDISPASYIIPQDILAALQANEKAWAFFKNTSPAYQRIRTAYVDTARQRPGEFEKRLEHLIAMSAQQKQFGYGIESYY